MNIIRCPNCKSSKMLLGSETFSLDTRVYKAPVLKCLSCGDYTEPIYAQDKNEGKVLGKKLLSIPYEPPLRLIIYRGPTLSKDRSFEETHRL